MNSPLISIVIPCYNCGAYINECIMSLQQQAYRNFEILAVNDGSRDRTLAILHELMTAVPNLTVIDKPNGGVSSARNAGIERAKGKWIAFVDSDDWVADDYLQCLVEAVENADTDWLTSGLYFCLNGEILNSEGHKEEAFLQAGNESEFLSMASQRLITSPVSKLYKRDIIVANNIRFDLSMPYGEDRDFNLKYLSHIDSCLLVKFKGYYYRRDSSESISHIKPGNLLMSNINYWNKLLAVFEAKQYSSELVRSYMVNRLYNFINDELVKRYFTKEEKAFIKSKVNFRYLKANRDLIRVRWIYRICIEHGLFDLLRKIYKRS